MRIAAVSATINSKLTFTVWPGCRSAGSTKLTTGSLTTGGGVVNIAKTTQCLQFKDNFDIIAWLRSQAFNTCRDGAPRCDATVVIAASGTAGGNVK